MRLISSPTVVSLLLACMLVVPQVGFSKVRKGRAKAKAARAAGEVKSGTAGTAGTAGTVLCTSPASGEKAPVRIAEIRQGLQSVRRAMQKHGVHILDLPAAVRERHVNLDGFMAEGNWCSVHSQVIDIEGALGMTKIDQTFISEKFARIERWGRSIDDTSKSEKIERLMANAAAQMADRRFDKANGLLNKVISSLFGVNDVWKVPEAVSSLNVGEGPVTGVEVVTKAEVEEGCPTLGKKGKANADELQKTLAKLRKLMDERTIRTMDYKGGEKLAVDLRSYVKLDAYWPAVRIACAMLARTGQVEIDLGVVQKRFHRAKNLQEERGSKGDEEKQFKELVRAASDQMMKREFAQAHQSLETLLVVLGEPAQPSAAVP